MDELDQKRSMFTLFTCMVRNAHGLNIFHMDLVLVRFTSLDLEHRAHRAQRGRQRILEAPVDIQQSWWGEAVGVFHGLGHGGLLDGLSLACVFLCVFVVVGEPLIHVVLRRPFWKVGLW